MGVLLFLLISVLGHVLNQKWAHFPVLTQCLETISAQMKILSLGFLEVKLSQLEWRNHK